MRGKLGQIFTCVTVLKSRQSQLLRIVVCYTAVFSVVTYSSQREFVFCVFTFSTKL